MLDQTTNIVNIPRLSICVDYITFHYMCPEMIFPINIGDLEVSIAGMVESGRKAGNFAECFEHILRHFRQRRVKVGGVTVLAASKLLQTYH